MKSTKKKAALISAIITMATLVSGSALSSNAATYTNGWTRGARFISYVETDFTWTVDNRYNITSSEASQWAEGFFTYEGGTTRTYAGLLAHHYNCRSNIRIGIGKLAYNKTFSDNIGLSNGGWAWNIDELGE